MRLARSSTPKTVSTGDLMSKIDDNLPTEVLTALADACGFRIACDRTPGVDAWTLSQRLPAGTVTMHVEHVGTRQSVCAFLIGFSSMQLQTTQILNEIDGANRRLILDMMARLGGRP